MGTGRARERRWRHLVPCRRSRRRITRPSDGQLRRSCAPPGFSLLELLLVVSTMMLLAAIATASTVAGIRAVDAALASHYLAGRLQLARLEAVKRGCHVGLRFESRSTGLAMSMYADGNGNGVRSADIARGADQALDAPSQLEDHFSGVGPGLLDGVKDPDSGVVLSGDPIRFGASNIVSFAPTGSATSGTIYLRGSGRLQYAVRVLGVTGRVRVMKYDFSRRVWSTP